MRDGAITSPLMLGGCWHSAVFRLICLKPGVVGGEGMGALVSILHPGVHWDGFTLRSEAELWGLCCSPRTFCTTTAGVCSAGVFQPVQHRSA